MTIRDAYHTVDNTYNGPGNPPDNFQISCLPEPWQEAESLELNAFIQNLAVKVEQSR